MKILHTSDWHLGEMAGQISLEADQRFFIDEICDIIEKQNIDAVIIAGDVYDRAVSSRETIDLYNYAMKRICFDMRKKAFLIAGNHDSAERLATCNRLLEQTGLYIQGALSEEVKTVNCDDVDIHLIPWITAEKVRSIYPDKKDEIKTLNDAYRFVTDRIREGFVEGRRNIAVSHSYIADSDICDSDKAANVGYAEQISASVFDGFDYVALGHLHRPQNITPTVRYSGTPMPYSFGKEETQEKSVTVIDTDTMEQTVVPLGLLHKRMTVEGTREEILGGTYPDDVKNAFVKVHITDEYLGLSAYNEIREIFPNAVEISGKNFESEDAKISLTLEQLETISDDPVALLKVFCKEEADEEPDEHIIEMFIRAVEYVENAKEEDKQ